MIKLLRGKQSDTLVGGSLWLLLAIIGATSHDSLLENLHFSQETTWKQKINKKVNAPECMFVVGISSWGPCSQVKQEWGAPSLPEVVGLLHYPF